MTTPWSGLRETIAELAAHAETCELIGTNMPPVADPQARKNLQQAEQLASMLSEYLKLESRRLGLIADMAATVGAIEKTGSSH